jgi:tetratricopeptide (TPR) repeat protein
MTVANYLWHGLDLHARAIEILLLAHKDGQLDETAQVQLVNWLHERNRHAESIPLLEPLVAAHPDTMHYRTYLMIAYHRSQRPQQLQELIDKTDAHFHQQGRWTEENIAQFARGAFDCDEWDRAIGYYTEAIALHPRSHPGQPQNDGTLSEFYYFVAKAQSKQGRTREAVDAVSAAIVCWSPRHERRASMLELLKQVLNEAKDLDAYVKQLDQETDKSGQDSPILRKALGLTYQARQEYAKAIVQLKLAVALQPHDKETHEALIACYDATQNPAAAMQELLALIDLNSHDLALYQQLADRLKNNEAEAERAATSIIESSPNEAESHAALAELRQKQNRWSEAIPHWEKVAELRRLEPTGLLKLAAAQIHEKEWPAARKSIETLERTEWPQRFSDVSNEIRRLQEQLPKK